MKKMSMKWFGWAIGTVLLATVTPSFGADDGGFKDLFNGKDLSNWQTRPEGKGKDCWTVGKPSVDPANPKNLAVASGGEAMVNVVTAFGPVRLDVATPLARRTGESRFNVYVSIGQAF